MSPHARGAEADAVRMKQMRSCTAAQQTLPLPLSRGEETTVDALVVAAVMVK
jgi:hypothetical protein